MKGLKIFSFTRSSSRKSSAFRIIDDAYEAFQDLGAELDVEEIPGESGKQIILRELVSRLRQSSFVFMDAQVGLGREIFDLLQTAKVPYAIWFHANPFLWSKREYFEYIRSPYCIPFLHDKSFFKKFRDLGFRRIFYLPLCSNPKRFKRIDPESDSLSEYRCDVSFAGGLFYKYLEMFNSEIANLLEQEARFCRAALEKYTANPLRGFSDTIREVKEEIGLTEPLPETFQRRLEQALILASSAKRRKDVIEELKGVNLRVYGGEDWRHVFQGDANFFGWIDNQVLPKLYNASKINLNITLSQLPSALPMRVFDITMCGAFLLTDYRPVLEDAFKIGEEVVVFKDLKDLKKKVEYYLGNESERREVARRGRLRALRDHTFKKRMLFLVDVMRGVYSV